MNGTLYTHRVTKLATEVYRQESGTIVLSFKVGMERPSDDARSNSTFEDELNISFFVDQNQISTLPAMSLALFQMAQDMQSLYTKHALRKKEEDK